MATSYQSSANDVNAASRSSARSGASGSRGRKAPKVVTRRNPYTEPGKLPDFHRNSSPRICTLNVRTLSATGAATLLSAELWKWGIQLAGLQEVRWPNSGETTVNNTTFLWSGRQDGYRKEGVALALSSTLTSACVVWAPVSERLLFARFRHSLGHVSIVVCYAPTDGTPTAIKE